MPIFVVVDGVFGVGGVVCGPEAPAIAARQAASHVIGAVLAGALAIERPP